MTWYIRGGSVFCVLRSTTTAPCPSSGRGKARGGAGGGGGSAGMNSFYRVGGEKRRSNVYRRPGVVHKTPGRARARRAIHLAPPRQEESPPNGGLCARRAACSINPSRSAGEQS